MAWGFLFSSDLPSFSLTHPIEPPSLHRLGQQPYSPSLDAMVAFTRGRNVKTRDQIWFLTHPPVLTLGIQGDQTHILNSGDLPVVRTDRGGQVTWHGPGQLIVYTLIDLQRRQLGIRGFVSLIERTVIDFLAQYGISAVSNAEAPGVYVSGKKIASVGLKVSKGCCYHGFSLNVDPDLSEFLRINPCGYPNLEITSLRQCSILTTTDEIIPGIAASLLKHLGHAT